MNPAPIILASTSPYRRELLYRLNVSFTAQAPSCDEDALKASFKDNQPEELAMYLAIQKAKSLSQANNCVIGSDQIVVFGNRILGKPHTKEKAIEQLMLMQGQSHLLVTATCVFFKGQEIQIPDATEMTMSSLSLEQVENYVKLDEPYDCAGSYKIEKHGISLFNQIKTEDFTGIQGLPLIKLSQILRKLNYVFP
jgi:septum formation protein